MFGSGDEFETFLEERNLMWGERVISEVNYIVVMFGICCDVRVCGGVGCVCTICVGCVVWWCGGEIKQTGV